MHLIMHRYNIFVNCVRELGFNSLVNSEIEGTSGDRGNCIHEDSIGETNGASLVRVNEICATLTPHFWQFLRRLGIRGRSGISYIMVKRGSLLDHLVAGSFGGTRPVPPERFCDEYS